GMLDRTNRLLATLTCLAAAGLWPAVAAGHGGTTIAEGDGQGVTIRVQGSDTTTPGGKPGADVSTVLAGPGSGPGSEVLYYVRPDGGKSFRVEAERDDSGTHHAEIATANRGDWRAWDVSAIVTLSNGKRLRVTNAGNNAPGPDPAQAGKPAAATSPEPTTASPEASAVPTSPEPAADAPVEDVSGQDEGAPSWALPSLAGLAVLGLFGVGLARRRSNASDDSEPGDDF
ncbi:MAG: hypothetical protein JHD16_15430, partial [Solirubrobacteraceae bacterium]|nr:hypothetical protein [Solirubrobacteraceae bacterium]